MQERALARSGKDVSDSVLNQLTKSYAGAEAVIVHSLEAANA